RFWDVSEDAILRNQAHFKQGQQLANILHSQTQPRAVAFSSDGKLMAQANTDGTIRLWGVQIHSTPSRTLFPALLVGLIAFLIILRLLVPILESQHQYVPT